MSAAGFSQSRERFAGRPLTWVEILGDLVTVLAMHFFSATGNGEGWWGIVVAGGAACVSGLFLVLVSAWTGFQVGEFPP